MLKAMFGELNGASLGIRKWIFFASGLMTSLSLVRYCPSLAVNLSGIGSLDNHEICGKITV
jgi:hypothetical protein